MRYTINIFVDSQKSKINNVAKIYGELRMDTLQPNMLKYENYKEQFKRLKRALVEGFNLEAIFIEYAIMEDRTESILKHADMWDAYIKKRKGHNLSIESKIDYIKKIAENKKDISHKYFSDTLLDDILVWKEERNRLVHALLKQQLQHNELHELAIKGNDLLNALRNRSGNYCRAIERRKSKDNHRVD